MNTEKKSFTELRQLYKEFIYKNYSVVKTADSYHVEYDFEISGLSEFKAKWDFPVAVKGAAGNSRLSDSDLTADPIFRKLIFSLGMVECISYYKITCPETFVVKCGDLTKKQLKWWRKLIYNGLGEFMYRNGIDISEDDMVNIICTYNTGKDGATDSVASFFHDDHIYGGCLTPVGGGKDSVVSLELLKGRDIITYTVNGNDTTRAVIDICDHKSGDYVAKRVLDKRMLGFNEEGYLNGHTPFSAIVAFSSVIAAYILGRKYITLSNETSANESTVKDSFVNHQYSKSYEFECDFGEYLKEVTDSDIHYFSMLRPLTELQIAALFSGFTKYHKAFRSCNAGSKQGIWCCDCPKCLFVYIILSPFLSEAELIEIFGEKLLDKESLDKDFRELIGIEENKPFECVGTRSEVAASMKEFRKNGGRSLLTDRYAQFIDNVSEGGVKDLLSARCDEHNVPGELAEIVQSAIEEYTREYLR